MTASEESPGIPYTLYVAVVAIAVGFSILSVLVIIPPSEWQDASAYRVEACRSGEWVVIGTTWAEEGQPIEVGDVRAECPSPSGPCCGVRLVPIPEVE